LGLLFVAVGSTFGIYGLRFTFTLPSRDAAAATRLAEAQLELEAAQRMREAAEGSTRQRVHLLRLAMNASEKRIELLTRAVDVARSRQQSITRLVVAGVRTPSDLMEAVHDVARRESDLLAARVERWKVAQTAKRLQSQRSQSILAAQARGSLQ
jgi:outer membrane protein TolC